MATRDEGLAGIAEALRRRGVRSLGLLGAGDVRVEPVAFGLARALAEESGCAAAVVTARPATGALPGPAGGGFTTTWLPGGVARLAPGVFRPGGSLHELLALARGPIGELVHLVVDLDSLEASGEHLAAAAALGGVALVARVGRTTAGQLQRRRRELADERLLGVVLLAEREPVAGPEAASLSPASG
jgi:hypothetical protein